MGKTSLFGLKFIPNKIWKSIFIYIWLITFVTKATNSLFFSFTFSREREGEWRKREWKDDRMVKILSCHVRESGCKCAWKGIRLGANGWQSMLNFVKWWHWKIPTMRTSFSLSFSLPHSIPFLFPPLFNFFGVGCTNSEFNFDSTQSPNIPFFHSFFFALRVKKHWLESL